ncbi:MAG: RHS repeat-associated core domain-containing protein [Candidatus Omnitrophota bacterium]
MGYIYTTSAVGTSGEMQLGLLGIDANDREFETNDRELISGDSHKISGNSRTNPRTHLRYVFDFLTSFLDPKAEAAVVPQATTTSTTFHYIGSLYEKAGTVKTKHIFLGNLRVCSIPSSGSLYYYHGDHLGSSNTITDTNGAILQRLEYDPFGKIALNSGTNKTDYKFTGKELDEETDLYYYGARYYFPLIGRFLTPDSRVQSPENPQTFNRYSYCNNNPVTYIDPSGNFWFIPAIIAAVKAVAAFAVAHPVIFGAILGGLQGGITAAVQGQNVFQGIGIGVVSGGMAGFGGINMVIGASLATGFLSTEPGQQVVNWVAKEIFDDAFGMSPRAAYFTAYLVTDAVLTAGISYGLDKLTNPRNAKVVKPNKLTESQKTEYDAILNDPKAMKSTNVTGREMLGDAANRIPGMSPKTYRALVVDGHVKAIIANDWIRLFGMPIPLQHTAVAVPGGGSFSTGLNYLWNSGVCHQERMLALRSAGVTGITPLDLNKSFDTWLSYGVYGTYGGQGYTIDNISKAVYSAQERNQ